MGCNMWLAFDGDLDYDVDTGIFFFIAKRAVL